MKYCLITLLLALSLLSCGKQEHADLFDYSKPVNLSYILQAYEWQKDYEEDDKDNILTEKIAPGLPEDDIYLFEDTSFVLRVPEYAASKQPFLANAEDFYNSCYLSCLKRIAAHPSDRYAMNCAAAIGGRTNMNRFGINCFGNECMIEGVMMMPKRYSLGDNSK